VDQPANPLSNPFPNPPGNPLALVSDYASDDDDDFSSQDNHESELSENDSGLDVCEFPPDAYLELLYKDSVSSTPGLRVVEVLPYALYLTLYFVQDLRRVYFTVKWLKR
jgi:hypothetical protein